MMDINTMIDARIAELGLGAKSNNLYTPIHYTMLEGGKRLRPVLALLCAEAFGGQYTGAIDAAVCVEVFHNFTLLHDDIMDAAPTRRGRDTVHVRWGANSAILSGDAMMIMAYEVLSGSADFPNLFRVFNKAALEVCEGQQLDMEFEQRDEVQLEEYLEMIRLKTAVLIAASAQMGALCGGASQQEQEAVYRYAENLGLAFQIQDDLLDTYGNAATFGKEIGGDIREGKQTFLRIVALDRANSEQKKILEQSRDYSEVVEVYDQLGVEEIAQKQIAELFEQSTQQLQSLLPIVQTKLKGFSDKILNREK